MSRLASYLAGLALAACAAAVAGYFARESTPPAQAPGTQAVDIALVAADMKELLATYRKRIVLTDAQEALGAQPRQLVDRIGRQLAQENLQRQARLDEALAALLAPGNPRRFDAVGALLFYVECDPLLFDADRLAFRDTLAALRTGLAKDRSAEAVKLHKRVADDLEALGSIERAYDKEIGAGHLDPRRERWESYVAHLKTLYQRDRILKEHGVELPAGSEFLPELVPAGAARQQAVQR